MKLSLGNQINRKMSRHLSYDILIEITFLMKNYFWFCEKSCQTDHIMLFGGNNYYLINYVFHHSTFNFKGK